MEFTSSFTPIRLLLSELSERRSENGKRQHCKSELMEGHIVKKKIGIGIAILGIIILCFLLNLFVIGETIAGNQLTYSVTQNSTTLELQVSATDSAVALRGWKIEQEENKVLISAKKYLYLFCFQVVNIKHLSI